MANGNVVEFKHHELNGTSSSNVKIGSTTNDITQILVKILQNDNLEDIVLQAIWQMCSEFATIESLNQVKLLRHNPKFGWIIFQYNKKTCYLNYVGNFCYEISPEIIKDFIDEYGTILISNFPNFEVKDLYRITNFAVSNEYIFFTIDGFEYVSDKTKHSLYIVK